MSQIRESWTLGECHGFGKTHKPKRLEAKGKGVWVQKACHATAFGNAAGERRWGKIPRKQGLSDSLKMMLARKSDNASCLPYKKDFAHEKNGF
jgi:hypothetical protein